MKPIALSLVLLLAAPFTTPVHAQDLWRCGADGRSYQATPCHEGRLVAADDARPAADVQAAKAVAAREVALADQLRRDRLREQADAQRSARSVLKPAAPAATRQPKAPKHRFAVAGISPSAAQAIRRAKG